MSSSQKVPYFFVAPTRLSEWDGSNSKVTKMILIVKLLKFSFVLEAIWKKANNIQAQSKQKFQLQIQKKERKKKEFSCFFNAIFVVFGALWSEVEFGFVFDFQAFSRSFFFPKILVCVFVFLLFYFANDHWSLAFFSVWDYVWFQSFFFCFGLYTSILFVCLSAHWNTSRWRQTGRKKFFVSCLSLATDGQKKTLFSFFWLDNRTFYGIFRA